jgi:hypothetical protein
MRCLISFSLNRRSSVLASMNDKNLFSDKNKKGPE